MARHEYMTKAKYYTCDCCGKKLMDGEIERSSISITIRRGHDIAFEWWNKGDYCYDCRDALCNAIEDAIPVPERYETKFHDEDVEKAIEIALIKKQIEVKS